MLLARRLRPTPLLYQLPSAFSDVLRQASSSSPLPDSDPSRPIINESIENIQAAMATTPTEAAEQLAKSLTPAQRALLASALSKSTIDRESDERYVHDLFEAADIDGDKQHLNRVEFQHALHLHRSLDGSSIRTPPDWNALRMVFIAAAIPFIGFGFLDNFIMLVAGEEIDETFGRRLGLTTLASAGLGNLVADVIGVGAANGIEASVRKLPYIRNFKLSKHQTQMPSARMTKLIGACAGVMLGCVLGLAPLFWSGSFFVPGGRM